MNVSSVQLWADRIMFYSLLPLAFFLPISSAMIEVSTTIAISAFFIKRILIFLIGVRDRKIRENAAFLKTVPHAMVLPVIIFTLATLLSVIFSQFPSLSWKGFFGKTIQGIVIFFAIIESFKTRQRLNLFLIVFSFSIFLVSLDGVWQKFAGKDFFFFRSLTPEGRLTGTFGHPNDYAAYLLVVTAFMVGLLVWGWQNRKDKMGVPRFILIAITAILAATSLGWTFSRGAWIGFACASFVLAVFHGKKWYIPLTFFVVFWVIFSSQLGAIRNVSFLTDDISRDTLFYNKSNKAVTYASKFNFTGRQVFWAETFEVFKHAPILGTGLNTYTAVVQEYNPSWSRHYAHNCYLQMLAEIGIVGLLSFLWVMWTLTREAWKAFFNSLNVVDKVFLIALFSGLLGFWVHSAADTNFYSTRLGNLMWVVMGLTMVVILFSRQKQPL